MTWRFTTDCLTGRRVWRWYRVAGRPERGIVWPCAKLGALGVPLLLGPAAPMQAVPLPSRPLLAPPLEERTWIPTPPSLSSEWPFSAEWRPASGLGWSSPACCAISTPAAATAPASSPGGETTAIPEPGSLAALAIGALGAVLARRAA